MKIEVQAPEATTIIEMENINFDAKLQDSDFSVPADVKLMDFPQRPTGAPGAPAAAPAAPPAAPAKKK